MKLKLKIKRKLVCDLKKKRIISYQKRKDSILETWKISLISFSGLILFVVVVVVLCGYIQIWIHDSCAGKADGIIADKWSKPDRE